MDFELDCEINARGAWSVYCSSSLGMFQLALKLFLRAGIVLSLTFAVGALAHADPASLASLDAILDKAGSASAFLESRAFRNRYYDEAVRYYGGEIKFSRKSYDAICDQFKRLIEIRPELAELAWRRRATRPNLRIKSELKSYGVDPSLNFLNGLRVVTPSRR